METGVECEVHHTLCDRQIDLNNVTAMTERLVCYPKTWGVCTSLATLLAGAACIVLADFGGPAWAFVVLGIWLWTIGLPTTVAVLLLVSLWWEAAVSISGSLGFFVVCAMILSLSFQIGSLLFVARIFNSTGKAGP